MHELVSAESMLSELNPTYMNKPTKSNKNMQRTELLIIHLLLHIQDYGIALDPVLCVGW